MVEEMKMLTSVKWMAVRCIVLLVACVGVIRAMGGDIFYFSSWPASGRVGAGEERVLRCAVSDTTSISLAWHLDGRLLTYTSRMHLRGGQRVETASDLVIRRAVPEDQGEYNCIAHNTTSGFALTSLPATLTVLWVAEESRVVLGDPKDLSTVRPGSSLKLRCRVDGGPELYYSWRRNGEALADVAGFTLSRRKLTISTFDASSHNGVYTCAATIYKHSGALHQSVRPAYLTSTTTHIPFILSIHDTGVPSVVVVPESVVVGPGRRVALHCSYEDHTTILWYLQDSEPLTNTSRHQVLANGTVVIWAATLGDEGVYRCEGVHPYRAHRASYAASLTLAYLDTHSPPVLEPDATIRNTHVVGLGGRLRVVCLPPAGLPRPQVSWEAPHLPEDSSLRVEGVALLVEDATFAQAGNYTCVAYNLAGNTSVSLQLIVTRKPEAQLVTSRVSVLEEETARLECRVDASPRPFTNVSWIRNNNPVSVDDYRVMVTGMEDEMTEGVSVLRIRWVRLQDEGLYACVVITAGHPPLQTPPLKLTVTERLKFSPLPHDVRVEVGANISVPCEARGADSPIIIWHHVSVNKLVDVGKKENMQSVDGRLEVAGAELKDSGQYMCVAASTQGSINTTISLTVIESPVLEWVTQGPVQVDKGGTLVLECHARGSPRPSIHWDYNHTTNALDLERVEVHGNGTLQVTGVRQEDGGVYGCTAGNMGGLVRAEISVTITGESSQLLGRTVGVAVGGAAAYMALVGAMLIYCRQRRQRLKHTPQHIRADVPLPPVEVPELHSLHREAGPGLALHAVYASPRYAGDGNEEAQNPEEQEKLVYSAPPGGPGDQDTRDVGTGTTITGSRMDTSCQVQLSQVSTHTLGTSTHLGLSQASTRTLGGSSISTQHSSPLQPNSSPSAQSAIHAGLSENMYVKPESSHAVNPLSHDNSIIQRENLQVLLTLGRGEFGDVQLARLRTTSEECDHGEDAPPDPEALVMVKVVSTRDEALLAEVCREAAMFGGPSHVNVVTTLGLCTSHTPHLLVTQYTDWGDMKQFLLATRKESPRPLGSLRPPPLSHTQCLNLSLQVAEGLEYLSGRRHTHRDVAARNCLITSTLQVKLASPALTRDAYAAEYCTYRNQVLPVRWLAQEALMEEEYSMKSSVLSWAWLVWEVLTQAAIPHSHLSDHQVIASAERGELECTAPPRTPADLESLLAGCWQLSPKARPSIHTVVDTLKAMT